MKMLSFAALLASVAAGDISFSTVFGSDMVLQRAPAKAAVYGTGPSGSQVSVGFNGKKYPTTVGSDGHWKTFLDPMPAGGNYEITAGDQTLTGVTFGDVWFCSGQSNMWLPLKYTVSRNESYAAAAAGKYNNVRMFNLMPNPQPVPTQDIDTKFITMNWTRADHAATNTSMETFSAICWYYAESLTDRMTAAGSAIPIGLVQSTQGGTLIEQWVDADRQLEVSSNVSCVSNHSIPYNKNTEKQCQNGLLYNGMVFPFVNMSVKGWLWYQGENNLFSDAGSVLDNRGYAGLLQKLISSWRGLWSTVAGTTSPESGFGIVMLADATDEGWGCNVPQMHWAETGNYGYAPNPALPNTFLATAHDIGEPWSDECQNAPNYCCVDGPSRGAVCGPRNYMVWESNYPGGADPTTKKYMGGIHPRVKKPVSKRLAQAAWSLVYGDKDTAWTGPVISGCDVTGDEIVVRFNTTFLMGDSILVKNYSTVHKASATFVLVGQEMPTDAYKNYLYKNRSPWWGDNSNWESVDIKIVNSNSISIDISALKGKQIYGVKYGHGVPGVSPQNGHYRVCCGTQDISTSFCPPENCPIMSDKQDLPAMPFLARIVDSKCKCLEPQTCDN